MQSSRTFELQTFGTPGLICHGDSPEAERLLGPGKPLALLVYCCAVRDRERHRDFLATLLWSDGDTVRSRQSLRQALWRIRSAIGDAFEVSADGLIRVDDTVRVDRDRFVAAVHRNDCTAALAEYRGPFLASFSVPGGEEFDEWAANERRHLEDSLVRVAGAHARTLARGGRVAAARDVLEQLMAKAPENLDAHRLAVEITVDAHDSANAQRYADGLELLARATGRQSPATDALVARARKTRAAAAQDHAERLTLDLVGREEAFGAVMKAWTVARAGTSQVIAMTGAAGIGKTRLLSALAHRCGSKTARAVVVVAKQGERDVTLTFAAAIARELATRPGAAGVSPASARELVALDPSLGSHFATASSRTDGTDAVRTRALAVLDLLAAVCEHEALALMLDDLHWADIASRQLLSMIVGRVSTLPLMLVFTSRSSMHAIGEHHGMLELPILPLRTEEVVDAIRSTGRWPDGDATDCFINSLAAACDGVPLNIVERLSLVRDRGLLVQRDGAWEADDWRAATREVAAIAPLDQRLMSCTATERNVLLVLAVAGVPVTEATVRRALGAHDASGETSLDGRTSTHDPARDPAHALGTLEVRGLVVRVADSWLPVHDSIAERSIALGTVAERDAVHLQLARVAATEGPDAAILAFRHYLAAGDDQSASMQFRRVLGMLQRNGDSRRVRDILQDLTGGQLAIARAERIANSVPLWRRRALPGARRVAAALVVVCAILVMFAWRVSRKPQLVISQAPVTTYPVTQLSARMLKTVPSTAIAFSDRDSPARGGTAVHVRSLSTRTHIVAGDSASVVDGVALFNALRFESDEQTIHLEFEREGYAPTTATVANHIQPDFKGIEESARLQLAGGILHGQRLAPGSAAITVPPGALIDGFVQAEFSTHWAAASVWLSMTPTWGDHKTSGRDLYPLTTPVRREIVDIPVTLLAPKEIGHYWIIFLLAAEPNGMFGVSRTNWTVGHPIWDDGNDLASTPDSVIREANVRGAARTFIAYPNGWNTGDSDCVPEKRAVGRPSIMYCNHMTALFGIEVNVR